MTIEIKDGTLKAVYGDYAIYKRDYLMKHLAREIYLLVSYERLPSIDAVQVIRCKDCKYCDGYYCHHPGWGDGFVHYTPPIKTEEGYCDWAERKEQ